MQRYQKRIPVFIALILLGWMTFSLRKLLYDILIVAALSVFFALVLSPFCEKAEKLGLSSAVSALLSSSFVLFTTVILTAICIPYIAMQGSEWVNSGTPTLLDMLYRAGDSLRRIGFSWTQHTAGLFADFAAKLSVSVAQLGMSLARGASRFLFSVIIAYYLLKARKNIKSHLLLFVPFTWRMSVLTALQSCANGIRSYLCGMLKTSLFITAAVYVGLMLLGIPNAPILSLFMGVMEIVPYAGPVLASLPIIISCLPMGLNTLIAAIILMILVQIIEGNLISPHFAASSTAIHPLTAILSVFVGGKLLGVFGIILAIPTVVIARSILWSVMQARNLMKA